MLHTCSSVSSDLMVLDFTTLSLMNLSTLLIVQRTKLKLIASKCRESLSTLHIPSVFSWRSISYHNFSSGPRDPSKSTMITFHTLTKTSTRSSMATSTLRTLWSEKCINFESLITTKKANLIHVLLNLSLK